MSEGLEGGFVAVEEFGPVVRGERYWCGLATVIYLQGARDLCMHSGDIWLDDILRFNNRWKGTDSTGVGDTSE